MALHAGDVEEGLIQGQRFDEGRVMGQDQAYLMGNTPVMGHAHRQEDAIRTEPAGQFHAHGRMDAISPGFIRRRRDDAPLHQAADDDRQALQGRIIPLFYRSIKRIHIDMHDPSPCHNHPSSILLYIIQRLAALNIEGRINSYKLLLTIRQSTETQIALKWLSTAIYKEVYIIGFSFRNMVNYKNTKER